MSTIRYDRLYSGADGISLVEKDLVMEVPTVDFAPPSPPFGVSSPQPCSALCFLLLPADFVGDWHPSPKRQWVFCLQGEMAYEAGDGTKWNIIPGSYLLTEDTSGQGHRSRVLGPLPCLLAVVQIES